MSPRRFSPIEPERLTDAQRSAVDGILGGPRGGRFGIADDGTITMGPFEALLSNAETVVLLERLGESVMLRNALPDALRELALLIAVRHLDGRMQWAVHSEQARSAGLPDEAITAIAQREQPLDLNEEQSAVFHFATELVSSGYVTDEQFEAVKSLYGERGVIDLISVIGYASWLALVLNVDRYPVPDGATITFWSDES